MVSNTIRFIVNGAFFIILGLFYDKIVFALGVTSITANLLIFAGIAIAFLPSILRREKYTVNYETNKRVWIFWTKKVNNVEVYERLCLFGILPLGKGNLLTSKSDSQYTLENTAIDNAVSIVTAFIPVINSIIDLFLRKKKELEEDKD